MPGIRSLYGIFKTRTVCIALILFLTGSCGSRELLNVSDPRLKLGYEPIESSSLHWLPGRPGQYPDGHPKSDLVMLALSGGGVKSSTFSAEAMFYLKAIGLLQKVNLVSSVSGGSYAAARYALSCDPGDTGCVIVAGKDRPVWDYRKTMRAMQNTLSKTRSDAIAGIFLPFVPTLSTSMSTRKYADLLEHNYLRDPEAKGPEFTFADLDDFRNRDAHPRPKLVLNATIASDSRYAVGLRKDLHYLRRRNADEFFHFAFTDFYFGAIGSDLRPLPVSYGVAASGAIPIVIDFVRLTDFRTCRINNVTDDSQCDKDRRNRLALMDGGANDNQGLSEIYATLGEQLLGEARSDRSPSPLPDAWNKENAVEAMARGDRALVIMVNSAITEATGVAATEGYNPWIFGNLYRSTGAVDIYAGTEVNLRRRLYAQSAEIANKELTSRWGYGPIHDAEIALLTLDKYRMGGIQAAAVQLADICLPGPGRICGPRGFDHGAAELAEVAPPRANAWKTLMQPATREKLMLSRIHPQCLFEEARFADGFVNGLMQLPPHVAVCLRHAARWATALTGQELCGQTGKDSPVNDRAALGCGKDGTLDPPHLEILRDENGKDALEECDLTKNARDDNVALMFHLYSETFMKETARTNGIRGLVIGNKYLSMSSGELGAAINNACTLGDDSTPDRT